MLEIDRFIKKISIHFSTEKSWGVLCYEDLVSRV